MAGPLYKTMLIMNSVLYIYFKMTGESIVANFAPLHIGGQGEWVRERGQRTKIVENSGGQGHEKGGGSGMGGA